MWVFQDECKKAHTLPTYLKVQWNDPRINIPLSLTSIQCKTLQWQIPALFIKNQRKDRQLLLVRMELRKTYFISYTADVILRNFGRTSGTKQNCD